MPNNAIPQTSANYRPDIDGLRAVSVIAVIGFHVSHRLVPGGYAGVGVFFAISGFLISRLCFTELEEGRFNLLTFYARRARQIFPALVLVLFSTEIAGAFLMLPQEFADLGGQIFGGAAFISNFIFWSKGVVGGYFGTSAVFEPLLHLWSLGIEEQFYALWPVCLLIFWPRHLVLPFTIVALAASLACSVWLTAVHPGSAFFLLPSRFWELMTGAALSYWQRKNRNALISGNALSVIGAIMVVSACLLLNDKSPFPGWRAVVPVLGTVLLIAAGPGAIINRALSLRPLVGIGLISYPLYLWHWPLLSFARIVSYGEPLPHERVLALIGCTFVLSWLTYKFVEMPIRTNGASKRYAAPSLFGGLAVAGLSGVVLVMSNGWMSRFPMEIQRYDSYTFDGQKAYRVGTCFIPFNAPQPYIGGECIDPVSVGGPLVLLWGDSYAAHLYPGLHALQATRTFRIAQFTRGGCSPIFGSTGLWKADCKLANDRVVEWIGRVKPDIILLAANWNGRDADAAARLASEQAGARRVVVVGPLPYWPETLPRTLARWLWKHPGSATPDRLQEGFIRPNAVHPSRTGYISAFDTLCNHDGCLALINRQIVTWDMGHLTTAGSELLITRNADAILGP